MLTADSDGVTPLPDDITGKVVVIAPQCFAGEYQHPKYQLFMAETGFGCKKTNTGTGVIGYHLFDKEKTRWERYELIGVANRRLVAQLIPKKEVKSDIWQAE
jgi:hypothetical protein